MKPLAVGVLVGVAPIVLAFVAGFFGATIGIGWPVYIGWLVICLVIGAAVDIIRR